MMLHFNNVALTLSGIANGGPKAIFALGGKKS
jgi:hypothetical protein